MKRTELVEMLANTSPVLAAAIREAGLGDDVLIGYYNTPPFHEDLRAALTREADTENGRRITKLVTSVPRNPDVTWPEVVNIEGVPWAPMVLLVIRWIRGMELPASLMALPEFAAAAADRLQP